MKDTHVIVVGAGIGGLAAALGLARAGQRVTVLEQVAELGEVGAGLSITPNAGKALIALGLSAELDRIGSRPTEGAMRHYATGEILVRLPQDRTADTYGVPLYHMHRADLHAALLAALLRLQPAAVHVGKTVVGVEQGRNAVSVLLASSERIGADWLVGADGIHSAVRSALFGHDAPLFTGFVAFRGLVPAAGAPASFLDPPLCMTMGPRRLLMRYPLRNRTVINFVALAHRSAWMEEGWSVRADLAELQAEFHDFEPVSQQLLALTPRDRLFKWGLFDRDPLPTWQRGLVTLLGDAAHPMPPFTGQGAVMALEDAAVLGRCAAVASDPHEAMQRYQKARYARVVAALAMSRARADVYFAPDPADQIKALAAGMAEVRTLYAYDAGSTPV
jgi:salicylate hydroxylase